MTEARRATGADAAELVRLRAVMLDSVGKRDGDGAADEGWREVAYGTLRARLDAPDPTLVVYVVDCPGGPDDGCRPGALAACATGTVEYRLGGPGNPSGESGYVFNVATDQGHRRRGYSRRCMTALLDWYRERGIRRVDLRASPEAEPLYRSMGFARTPDPAMRLRLGPAPGG